jgi:hypothetical protein
MRIGGRGRQEAECCVCQGLREGHSHFRVSRIWDVCVLHALNAMSSITVCGVPALECCVFENDIFVAFLGTICLAARSKECAPDFDGKPH